MEGLRAQLEASRASLLAALQGLTDRDFAAELAAGETIVAALAVLAAGEREAVQRAREAVGLPPRPLPAGGGARTRPLPPQVMHDLAGARYEAVLFLDQLDAGAAAASPDEHDVSTLLAGVAEREEAAAVRIERHKEQRTEP